MKTVNSSPPQVLVENNLVGERWFTIFAVQYGSAGLVGAEAVGDEALGAETVGADAVGAQTVGDEALGAETVGAQADVRNLYFPESQKALRSHVFNAS